LSFDLQRYLKARKNLIDRELERLLPPGDRHPKKIHQAVRYSVFAGGKRLRPILLMAGYETFKDDYRRCLPFACALEMLHTYSLIHDDLPAMDDDDFRRGSPTSHKVFGESTAILAGDALQAEAFGLMARAGLESGFPAKNVLGVISEMASASGLAGMITGQALDMETQGKKYTEADLEFIHRHKTSALIRASIVMGARLAGAREKQIKALAEFGERIGLAFQVADDILDMKGGKQFGKPRGSDKRKKKATYTDLFGLNKSEQRSRELVSEALHYIDVFSARARPLREIAKFLIERTY
jgi:geranylgeranyl diphosphate synthase, type II